MSEIKVLCVIGNLRNNNGVANCIINYYDALLQNNVHMDFMCLEDIDSDIKQKILASGSKYFVLPQNNNKATAVNTGYIKEFFSSHQYSIVHVNIIGGLALAVLKAAKKNGVDVRILHSHNPKVLTSPRNIIRTLRFTRRCNRKANYYLACSEKAGKSIFGRRKFTVLNNALDTSKYKYDENIRNSLRKEYDVGKKFVVGTACRQVEQKNPFFLLDIFKEVVKIRADAVLLWAGYGKLFDDVQEYAQKLGIRRNIILLGNCENMEQIYSAMDVFVLPSKYEGLGMVFIEAQCNGLYCFASTAVPKNTALTDNIEYLPLYCNPKKWAEKICSSYSDRTADYETFIKEHNYSLETEKNKLFDFYANALEKRE